jgi:catechol 2,3-dioxygenase-like lactoylglutathione lyase family enzyme
VATITGFYHVGMVANDPAALAEFYRDVLEMTITGGSSADGPFGPTAFLSSRPEEEDHELAIFADARYRHLAFKVASLADLRVLYHQVVGHGIRIKLAMIHGCSLAFYFDDPEGNMIEVYWPTDLRNSQPHGERLDLEASEEDLIAQVARIAAGAGGDGRSAVSRAQPPPTSDDRPRSDGLGSIARRTVERPARRGIVGVGSRRARQDGGDDRPHRGGR